MTMSTVPPTAASGASVRTESMKAREPTMVMQATRYAVMPAMRASASPGASWKPTGVVTGDQP